MAAIADKPKGKKIKMVPTGIKAKQHGLLKMNEKEKKEERKEEEKDSTKADPKQTEK